MDYIEIDGVVKAVTEKAILFSDGTREVWIPKSQLEDMEIKHGVAMITIPEWLAIEKELV